MTIEEAKQLVIDFMKTKGYMSNENSFSKANLEIQTLSHAGISQGGGNFERMHSAVQQLLDQHVLMYHEIRSVGPDGTVRISLTVDHEDKLYLRLE